MRISGLRWYVAQKSSRKSRTAGLRTAEKSGELIGEMPEVLDVVVLAGVTGGCPKSSGGTLKLITGLCDMAAWPWASCGIAGDWHMRELWNKNLSDMYSTVWLLNTCEIGL
jgi:hypothetical protein